MDINSPDIRADRALLAERCTRCRRAEEIVADYIEGLESFGMELTFSEKTLVRLCLKRLENREDELDEKEARIQELEEALRVAISRPSVTATC